MTDETEQMDAQLMTPPERSSLMDVATNPRIFWMALAWTAYMFACLITYNAVFPSLNGEPQMLAYVYLAQFAVFTFLMQSRWGPWVDGETTTAEFLGSFGVEWEASV